MSPYNIEYAPPEYRGDEALRLRDPHVEKWGPDFFTRMKELRLREQQWMAHEGREQWKLIKQMNGFTFSVISKNTWARWNYGSNVHSLSCKNVDKKINHYEAERSRLEQPVQDTVAYMTPILDEMCKLMDWDEHAETQRTLSGSSMSFGDTFLQTILANIRGKHRQTLIDLARKYFEVDGRSDDYIYDRMLLIICGALFDDWEATMRLFRETMIDSREYRALKCDIDPTISHLPSYNGVPYLLGDAIHTRLCERMEPEEEQWKTSDPELLKITKETEFIHRLDYIVMRPEERTRVVDETLAAVHPSLQKYANAHLAKKILQARVRYVLPKEIQKDFEEAATRIIRANAYVVTAVGWARTVLWETRYIIETSQQLITDATDAIAFLEAKRKEALCAPVSGVESPPVTAEEADIVETIADFTLETNVEVPSESSGEALPETTGVYSAISPTVEEGGKKKSRSFLKYGRLFHREYLKEKPSRSFLDRFLFRRSPRMETENPQPATS